MEQVPAKMMRVGDKVVRGRDWQHGNADGNGQGTITKIQGAWEMMVLNMVTIKDMMEYFV